MTSSPTIDSVWSDLSSAVILPLDLSNSADDTPNTADSTKPQPLLYVIRDVSRDAHIPVAHVFPVYIQFLNDDSPYVLPHQPIDLLQPRRDSADRRRDSHDNKAMRPYAVEASTLQSIITAILYKQVFKPIEFTNLRVYPARQKLTPLQLQKIQKYVKQLQRKETETQQKLDHHGVIPGKVNVNTFVTYFGVMVGPSEEDEAVQTKDAPVEQTAAAEQMQDGDEADASEQSEDDD